SYFTAGNRSGRSLPHPCGEQLDGAHHDPDADLDRAVVDVEVAGVQVEPDRRHVRVVDPQPRVAAGHQLLVPGEAVAAVAAGRFHHGVPTERGGRRGAH